MKKILAIDDQKDNLITIKGFIKNFLPNCILFLAQSGKEGIAVALKEQPDVILLDIIMPEMDGFEVCTILKQDDKTKFIPILMLSALGQDQKNRAKGLNLGADAFLVKPFNHIELKAQINVLLRIKEAEDKLRAEKYDLEETVDIKAKELIESERKITTLINNLQGIAYRCLNDKNWTMEFISDGIKQITGYDAEDFIGTNKLSFNDLIIPDDRDKLWDIIQLAIKNRVPFKVEYQIRTANGELKYLAEKGLGIFNNDDGELIALEGFITDITESKLAEDKLRESELKFNILTNQSTEGIGVADPQGNYTYVNSAFCNMLGWSEKGLLNMTVFDVTADKQDTKTFKDIKTDKEGVPVEVNLIKKDGTTFLAEVTGKKLFINGKENILGTIRDITAQRKSEESLRQSEKDYRDLFNNSTDAIYIQDKNYHFIDVNDGAVEMYGYPKEFFIGKTPEFLSAPGKNDLDKTLNYLKSAFNDDPQQYDFWGIRKNGEVFPKIVRSKKGRYKGIEVVITIANDITERKQVEEAVRRNEELYRNVFNNSPLGIFHFDSNGVITKTNDELIRILGSTRDKLVGLNMLEQLNDKNICAAIVRTLKKGSGYYNDYYTSVTGQKTTPLVIHFKAIHNSNNKIIGGVSIVEDITEQKLAEEQLTKLSTAVTQSPSVIVITDLKGNVEYANPKFTELTGYTNEDAKDLNTNILRSGNQSGVFYKKLWDTIISGKIWQGEFHNKKKNGELFWEAATVSPIIDKKGKIINYLKVAKDITEQKNAEVELERSEKLFKRLFDGLADGVFVTEMGGKNKGKILEVNQAAIFQTGYSRSELLKLNIIHDLFVPGSSEDSLSIMENKLKNGETVRITEKKKRKDGSEYWTEVSITQIDYKGTAASLSINHDITNRILAEEALKESEIKYRKLIDTTAEGFWLLNSELLTIDVNKALCTMLGYSKEDILGKSPLKFVDVANKKIFSNQFSKVKSTIHRSYEVYLCNKNGNKIPTFISATTLYSDDGKVTGSFAFVTNLTDKKLIEEKAFKFSKLFEDSFNEIFLFDADSLKFIQVNNAGINNLGYSLDELQQLTPIDIKPEYNEETFKAILKPLISDTNKKIEFKTKHKRKDGSTYFVEINLQLVEYSGSKFFAAIVQDITDKKQKESQLKAILENSNVGFAISTISTGQVNYLNEAFTDAYHIPPEICTTVAAFFEYVYIDRDELANEILADLKSCDPERMKWEAVPIIDRDTKEVTFVSAINIMLHDQDIMISSVWDITELKESQDKIKNALEKATESDRLKSAFLATISHELRTPLNAIIGFSDLISTDWPMENILDFGSTISTSGKHLLSIVNDIFDITLIEAGESKVQQQNVNVKKALLDANNNIKGEESTLNKSNLDLTLVIPDNNNDLIINTDPFKFKQVLINILKNALKFTHEGHINYGYVTEIIDSKSVIKFFVEDTGIGIPKNMHSTIFDTFVQADDTVTRTYGGMGIGLSISKKLVKLLGGDIWFKSTEGVGTTFYFTLPNDTVIEASSPIATKQPTKTNFKDKTILIVEDDKDSADYLEIILNQWGIVTIWGKDGEESIKICAENNNIDLVLMDINMPVMNGHIATRKIKTFRPDLPIIAQTALAMAGDKEKSIEAGCDDYISKPINKDKLLEIISKRI